ncbi:MAG: Rho termination factor N-terminal domain-containing protein, partial [Pyrinomonadaceae bacterium]
MPTKTTRTRINAKPENRKEENGFEPSSPEIKEAEEPKQLVSGNDGNETGDGKSAVMKGELHNLAVLKEMSISQLTNIAKDLGVEGASGLRKQELIFKVLAAQTEKSGLIFS